MTRVTDTHRGARIAFDLAAAHVLQPDLFGGVLPREFWQEIARAAADQLADCNAYEAACGRRTAWDFSDDCDGEPVSDSAPEPVCVQ